MIHKRTPLTVRYNALGNPAIFTPEGVRLRRLVGGLAWTKALAPGAFVVLGEQMNADPISGRRMVRVVEFVEESDTDLLLAALAQAAEWTGDGASVSLVKDWVGDPDHAMARRLIGFNRLQVRARAARVTLKRPPLLARGSTVADFTPYLAARAQGADLIRFDCPQLVERVEESGRELGRGIRDFPAVAALFWALAWLDEHEPRAKPAARTAHGPADPVGGY